MTIAWIAAKIEPQLIKTFGKAGWGIKVFAPAECRPCDLLATQDMDVIVMEVIDHPLLHLCKEICRQKIAPLLTIVNDLAYAQATLEDGADDFLIAPLHPIEALLRVRKLARITDNIRVGDLEIDLAAWRVSHSGQRIHLSTIEFRLLACLARRVGQMVSQATILEEVWAPGGKYKTSVQVATYIGRLRRKLEPNLGEPQYIISIPGTGYRLRNQRQWEANRREFGRPNVLFKAAS